MARKKHFSYVLRANPGHIYQISAFKLLLYILQKVFVSKVLIEIAIMRK